MSFMDDFEEADLGTEVDLSGIFPGDDDPTPTPSAGANPVPDDATTDPDPAKYVKREDFETLQSQFKDQVSELKDLLLAQRAQPQIQYVQPQQHADPAALKAQNEQAYYADPTGYTLRAAQLAATNSVGGELAAVKEMLADNVVNNFIAGKKDEPVYKVAKKHFDEMLNKVPRPQLAAMKPTQIHEFLDIAYSAAKGKVYDDVVSKQQKANPRQPVPAYGTGAGAASAGRAAPSAGGHNEKLAAALGLTAEDFADIVE